MSGMDDRIGHIETSDVSVQLGTPVHGRAKLVQVKTGRNGQTPIIWGKLVPRVGSG